MTEKQEKLMEWVSKVAEPGTRENDNGYFYCECAPAGIKPFSMQTVQSLIKKEKIQLADHVDTFTRDFHSTYGVFALQPYGYKHEPKRHAPGCPEETTGLSGEVLEDQSIPQTETEPEETEEAAALRDKVDHFKEIMITKEQEATFEILLQIHTNLRKGCDSDETSLLYNAISICDEAWDIVGALVSKHLVHSRELTGKSLQAILLNLSDNARASFSRESKLPYSQLYLMEGIAQLCEEGDFEAMVQYVPEIIEHIMG